MFPSINTAWPGAPPTPASLPSALRDLLAPDVAAFLPGPLFLLPLSSFPSLVAGGGSLPAVRASAAQDLMLMVVVASAMGP